MGFLLTHGVSPAIGRLRQRYCPAPVSLSESSVAVQMQGGCVSAHARAIDTVQVPAMCHRAIATVQAPAMCHCQKLSRAGVHTSGAPHASFLLSLRALSQ